MSDTTVVEVPSAIGGVEVYRSEALVTRKARVTLSAGLAPALRLEGLPVQLVDSSVRLALRGVPARLEDLHVELRLGAPPGSLQTAAEEERRRRRRAAEVKRARLQLVEDRIGYLLTLGPRSYLLEELPERLALEPRHQVEHHLALAGYVRRELERLQSEARQLRRELRELDDQLREAEWKLTQESVAQRASLEAVRKAVLLHLAPLGVGGELELEVSYLVPGARWVPEYEVRVSDVRDDAELVVRASLAQQTGEDWPRVPLALSSADLQRSCALPELDSWRIGRAQPPRRPAWRELPKFLDELFDAYDRHPRPPAPPALPSRVQVPALPPLEPLGETRGGGQPLAEPRAEIAAKDGGRHFQSSESDKKAAPPPPPAPRQAPPSMLPPMPEAFGGAPCESAAQAAPQPRRSRARQPEEPAANIAPSEAVDAPEPEPPPEIEARGDALAYERLRMVPPAEQAGRGQLRALRPTEQLAVAGGAGVEPAALAHHLERQRAAVARLAAPPRTVAVDAAAGHFAVRYQAESPAEVASDGEFHSLTLLRRRASARRIYRTVPRVEAQVYQLAVFDNPLELSLLAGPVRVYHEGDFVVTAALETVPPGKPIVVNLGVEPAISVARNTRFQETTEGLLGGDTALRHEIEIELRSMLPRPARVEVFERVPLSQRDEIRVELLESRPRATRYDQEDRGHLVEGGYRFSLELAPRETQTCTLVYRVVISSKQMLVGGNRRD